jgi:hypothetical protein
MSNEITAQKILLGSTLVVEKWKAWCGSCGHGNLDLPYGIPGNQDMDACPQCSARWLYSASTYYFGTLEETKQHVQGVYTRLRYIGIAEPTWSVDDMTGRPHAEFVELIA